MFVAVCRVALVIPSANSLKAKRMVLRSVLDSIRARFNVAAAEVGDQDLWQRALIGFAVVSNEGPHANSMADNITRVIDGMRDCYIGDRSLEILSFGHELGDFSPSGGLNR